MSPHEQRLLRVLGIGLVLLIGLSFFAFVMTTPFYNSPPKPTPTLGFTPQEEMQKSAYYACAKQFDPSVFDWVSTFPVKSWSIVPYPRFGYSEDREGNLQPAVLEAEDNLYYVNFFVDYTFMVVDQAPYTGETTTTRQSSRDRWQCDARYLGIENGIKRWDVEIYDLGLLRGCVHPSAYSGDVKSPLLADVVICK